MELEEPGMNRATAARARPTQRQHRFVLRSRRSVTVGGSPCAGVAMWRIRWQFAQSRSHFAASAQSRDRDTLLLLIWNSFVPASR